MNSTFTEKWLQAVIEKESVLCAGLDPADFIMFRGDEGLPENKSKYDWSLEYIDAIAPFCAAIKPNIQYWKGKKDLEILSEICSIAKKTYGLLVIDDSKLADIGSTNDAGMFYAKQRADAVTLAPFAGNMEEAAKQAKARDFGLIGMCLMSNPEYETEKNKLIHIPNPDFQEDYAINDLIYYGQEGFIPQYIKLAHDANEFGLDGIVIGAPSKKNHIKEEELKIARAYAGSNMLVLLPGVGAQGGEADAIWKYFDKNNVIVNVGRGLMFPKGSNSTPKDQKAAAIQYRDMLNNLREQH